MSGFGTRSSTYNKRFMLMVMVVVAMVAAIYFVFDPSAKGNLFPRCIFFTLSGLKCPGCGTQRALHALTHGDVASMLHYNAALPVAALTVGAYVVAEWQRDMWPRFHSMLNSRWAALAVAAAIVAWWVLRNMAVL